MIRAWQCRGDCPLRNLLFHLSGQCTGCSSFCCEKLLDDCGRAFGGRFASTSWRWAGRRPSQRNRMATGFLLSPDHANSHGFLRKSEGLVRHEDTPLRSELLLSHCLPHYWNDRGAGHSETLRTTLPTQRRTDGGRPAFGLWSGASSSPPAARGELATTLCRAARVPLTPLASDCGSGGGCRGCRCTGRSANATNTYAFAGYHYYCAHLYSWGDCRCPTTTLRYVQAGCSVCPGRHRWYR